MKMTKNKDYPMNVTTHSYSIQGNLHTNMSQRKHKDRSYSRQYNLVTSPNMAQTLVQSIEMQPTLITEVPLSIFAFHMKLQ